MYLRKLLVSLIAVPILVGCGASVLPTIHSDSERLAVARRMVERREYGEAVELLKSYIASSGGSADVDEAIYLLGRSYLGQKEWVLAQGEFERLLRDYPESDSAGAASFRMGEALFGQTRPRDFDQEFTVKAIDQWQSYLRDYPGHWLNPEAEHRIFVSRTRLAEKLVDTGNLYLKLKQPGPARMYYQKVTEEYPDTTATPFAEIGLALCEAAQGRRDQAVAQLRQVESRYAGQPPATRAARERSRLERR
jgi:outer membrane protein assembly factor BamD